MEMSLVSTEKEGKWPQMNQVLLHSQRKLILKSTIINGNQSITSHL